MNNRMPWRQYHLSTLLLVTMVLSLGILLFFNQRRLAQVEQENLNLRQYFDEETLKIVDMPEGIRRFNLADGFRFECKNNNRQEAWIPSTARWVSGKSDGPWKEPLQDTGTWPGKYCDFIEIEIRKAGVGKISFHIKADELAVTKYYKASSDFALEPRVDAEKGSSWESLELVRVTSPSENKRLSLGLRKWRIKGRTDSSKGVEPVATQAASTTIEDEKDEENPQPPQDPNPLPPPSK